MSGSLLTDGQLAPLGVDRPPLLSWPPNERQAYAQVQVLNADGSIAWDSGAVTSTVPELRPDIAIRSRMRHSWQVRISADAETWSEWATGGFWENGLLDADWTSHWIGRAVGAENRIARHVTRGEVEWAHPGDVLAQRFTSAGAFTSVHADLTGIRDVDVSFRLEVVDSDGAVVAAQLTDHPQHIWDRFMNYVELDPPAPAGDYELRLAVDRGQVGWHTDPTPEPSTPATDDGLSPLAISGNAKTAGVVRSGRRTIGVETVPAPNPRFRTRFLIDPDDMAASSRLYGVALGNGIFRINGTPVDDSLLDPAPTDFRVRALYRTWDVSSLLRAGWNELTVDVGRGTFAVRGASVWGWNLAPWHAEPMVRAQLEWDAASGAHHVIATDDSWEAAAGSTVSEHWYAGEVSVSGQDAAWEPVTIASGAGIEMSAAALPPIRVIETLVPTEVVDLGGGRRRYDFGRVLTGRMRCHLRGSAGSSVLAIHGEQLDDAGGVVCRNGLASGRSQVDEHRFGTDAELKTWEVRFGYRGFRWVEIVSEGEVVVDDVHAVVLHNDVETVGAFAADDALLDWMDGALRRTFLNNLQGIPTDTPIYEKNGWTADAHLATEALLQQLDLRAAFTKWMQDHADSQGADGSIPQIVPSPDWATAPDPAWSGSAVLIPWQMYQEYGDIDQLCRFAPMIERYAAALLDVADDAVWPIRSWGDWLPPGHGLPPEGAAPAATAMMVDVLRTAARILAVLGREADARELRAAADRTTSAYHEAYFSSDLGVYSVAGVGYRQALNALPLAFGMVPDANVESVGNSLIADIERRTSGHLDVGAIAWRHLLPVLDSIGRADLALTVATAPTGPGWGAWYATGQHTLMESWDSTARSHNHYFLGSAFAWVHRRVGGMGPSSPGWATIDVDPIDDPRIGHGMRRHRTVRGEAAVSWRRTDEGTALKILVPVGSQARVRGGESGDIMLPAGRHRFLRRRDGSLN